MLRVAVGRIGRAVINTSQSFLDAYIELIYEEVRSGFSWGHDILFDESFHQSGSHADSIAIGNAIDAFYEDACNRSYGKEV